MRRFYIKTFGCQMNDHDSRKIAALLQNGGWQAVPAMELADLILFNTCTIRDKAHHKAISEIGRTARIKAERPKVIVGVCGCVAQQEKEALFDKFPHIDLLFGPDQIGTLAHLLEELAKERRQVAALDLVDTPEQYKFLNLVPWSHARKAPPHPDPLPKGEREYNSRTPKPETRATRDESRATAFITIMKGCDANCAYCIVPKVRGREVCRLADEIISEVKGLVVQGVREVTLLGQTVNTYGSRRHSGTIPFHELLQRIADETEIARIRFTSPHPKDVSSALIEAYSSNAKLCPHIHLPLQAGTDSVLRGMRRSYSCQQFLTKVDALRQAVADIAITTDMIVGFPGESDSDFEAGLDFVRQIGFEGMFAFKYSPRPGTESYARLKDDVAEEIKRERLARLLELNAEISARKLEAKVGTTQEILVEGESRRGNQYTGRTLHNTIVNFTAKDIQIGELYPVEITKACANSLEGLISDS